MNDLNIPAPQQQDPWPPPYSPHSICVPVGMHGIIIIEFQGSLRKTAILRDSNNAIIEQFDSCYSDICASMLLRTLDIEFQESLHKTAILKDSNNATNDSCESYTLELHCYFSPCGVSPSVDEYLLYPTSYATSAIDCDSHVFASTLVVTNNLDPSKDPNYPAGKETICVNIIYQMTPCFPQPPAWIQ